MTAVRSKARIVVTAVLVEGRSKSEVARDYGVSRRWVITVVQRFLAEGEAGLAPRSRRPRSSPHRTARAIEDEIVELRKELDRDGHDAGAATIAFHLGQRHGATPAVSTIWRILTARGFVTPQPHKRPKSSFLRFAAEQPNERWQLDITHWALADGFDAEILNVLDDHSRLCLRSTARTVFKSADVDQVFRDAAAQYGDPAGMLSDNGAVFTGRSRRVADFANIVVLHALVDPPSDPDLVGTDVVLSGVTADQVAQAKALFLQFSGDTVLETTDVGQVLAKRGATRPGRIYVKGLLVAEEPNFLFSYNITALNTPLRRALNRERSNVGRTAYTDRVKKILTACTGHAVAGALSADLAGYETGRAHDEILSWTEVAVHACRVLQTYEKVLFVTAFDLAQGSPQLDYARDEGYRLVVVPGTVAAKLARLSDLNGRPMVDLSQYRRQWNDSFAFTFVAEDQLSTAERVVFGRAQGIVALAGRELGAGAVREILVSETMRLSEAGDMTLGLWQPDERRIIVRRDQLASLSTFAGVLLHEIGHVLSGETDGSLAFEAELTRILGLVAEAALRSQ